MPEAEFSVLKGLCDPDAGKDGADPPIYDADGDVFRALEARFPGR